MIAWMLYATVVGFFAIVAALAAESVLRMHRRPTRFAWIAAAAFTLGLAGTTSLRKQAPAAGGERIDPSSLALVQTSLQSVERHVPASAASYAIALWMLATLLVTISFVAAYARLRRARRAWPLTDLHERRVRVSPAVGPIVVGIVRPEVVVPRWVLTRSADQQRMIVAHEASHIDARDPMILAAACAFVALMPWNAALWFMLSRIRLAIEVDCDARVLRRGVSAHSYGSLLVDVAESAAYLRLAAPALADDSSHLRQRILAMQPSRFTHPLLRGAAVAIVGLVALLAACEAKMPTAADVEQMDASSAEQRAKTLGMVVKDTAVRWVVDGRIATAGEAKAISRDSIAEVSVDKSEGNTRIYLLTKAAQKLGIAGRVDTVRFAVRGARNDSISVIQKLQTASTQEGKPLMFIDGARAEESALKKLDPKNIDHVDVIKGPTALERYGADAKSGVILITTKPAGTR